MHRVRTLSAIVASVAITLAGLSPVVAAAEEEMAPAAQVSTSDVSWFPGTPWAGAAIPGASASLVTYEEGISAVLATAGLEPGHAVTLWWVVFNHPEACAQGEFGLRCGEGDLLLFDGDPAVEGTVLYATGHVIGPDGTGHLGAYLPTGDASDVVGIGPGLTNPMGADIHLVVRTHGPFQEGLFIEQLSTFGGGCDAAPEGTGTSGTYGCTDIQFAAFEPTLGS